MKKKWITAALTIAGLAVTSQAGVLEFTDNFNRADVAGTSTGSAIGANYVITGSGATPQFQIINNQLAAAGLNTYASPVLSYQGFALKNENPGESFTVSADITTHSAAVNLGYGVVFNFQSSGNYYLVRLNTVNGGAFEFVKVKNGSPSRIGDILNPALAVSTTYKLTVSSDTVGVFDYSLVGDALNFTGTFTDSTDPLSGGYAGLWNASHNATPKFDNFSVTTIPEPTILGLFTIHYNPIG